MNVPARTRYQPLAWLERFSNDPAEKEAAHMALDRLDATATEIARLTAALNDIRSRGR